MVSAAVLPRDRRVHGVRDSKLLTEKERERLFDRMSRRGALRGRIGWATRAECDELGMTPAQKLAARRAIEGLAMPVDAAVVDGRWDFVDEGGTASTGG